MNDTIEDMTAIMFFLLHAEKDDPGMMYGSHSVQDVWIAACRLFFPGSEPADIKTQMENM